MALGSIRVVAAALDRARSTSSERMWSSIAQPSTRRERTRLARQLDGPGIVLVLAADLLAQAMDQRLQTARRLHDVPVDPLLPEHWAWQLGNLELL